MKARTDHVRICTVADDFVCRFFVQTYDTRRSDVLSVPLCPILPSYSPIYVYILRDQCRLMCTPAYVVVTWYERRLIRERLIGVKTCTKDSTLCMKYR